MIRRVLGAGIALLVLSGCATTGDAQVREGASARETPAFEGPWASDFESAYSRAVSTFERSALADGSITDSELAEARERFSTCLKSFGIVDVVFQPDGAFEFTASEGSDPDRVNEQVGDCSEESGEATIGALHAWIRRNPEKLDDDTIIAACMVRKGAVDPSYGADDFARDEPELSFPYLKGFGDDTFQQCNADPLGRFE